MPIRAHAVPIRIRLRDREMVVDVLRGVGWRAKCPCGWETGRLGTRAEATRAAIEHNESAHA